MAGASTGNELIFFVNGKKVIEKNADPEVTLLQYLRNKLRLPGTKLGCAEGGCGACTVMVSKYDTATDKIMHFSVNACLAPVCSMHGLAVTTVEGIGSTKTRLHPVQERIAKSHGSQCGFCTPGIVMSMYTLLRNNPQPTLKDMESAFEGNLCRCTGYRPILDGFKTFTKEFLCSEGVNCCKNKPQTVEDVTEPLFEPNDFTPLDPSQEPIFPPELQLSSKLPNQTLTFKGERVTWIRPVTLGELLKLKQQHPQAKLVIGNTEIGVEVKFKNMHYPVILSPTHIPELNVVEYKDTGIVFGASVTLTKIDEELKEVIEKQPERKTRIFTAIVEMLRWFAGHQIRNVAAAGGNIITGSPISDLNPLFMSAGCTLTLASAQGGRRTIPFDHTFYLGYRKTALKPDEILVSIHIPYTREHEYFMGYKQAQRREDDIAIVNAGFRVLFEDNTNKIQEMALSYGGMAPTTVMALKTAQNVKGRLWDDELMSSVCEWLADDLPLSPSAPGGQIEYRRTLTVSFFFKFYLTVLMKLQTKQANISKSKVPSSYKSATPSFHRDSTKSAQIYDTPVSSQPEHDAVGRPIAHVAGARQATGEAVYCDDMPHIEGELYLALVTSTKAHAKIRSIDATEALTVPGVKAFLSHKDVPGNNVTGPVMSDEEVFASEEVEFIGHVLGAIVADNQVHAQRAAKMVKVEYEDLPAIVTIEEAITQDSYMKPIGKRTISNGNIEEGFAQADHTLEGEMRLGGQEHFYLETNATIAVPKEDGEMEVFSSSQNPSKGQLLIASALGVPANRINVRVKRMGGGFGGKETRFNVDLLPVAVAAAKLNVPVRSMLDRDEDMVITGGRHPFLAKYKVGFTSEGKITALEIDMYLNCGHSMDLSFSVMERALFSLDVCYKIPNIRATGHLCKTNLHSNTAFRGFGGPQGMMFTENWISDIAVELGITQQQVREINMYKDGDRTHFNQQLVNFTAWKCWEEMLQKSEYKRRRKEVDVFNCENRWKKRGIAITQVKFGISFTAKFMNQGGAFVNVYTDGSVLVAHGGCEMGQGLHTKMIQVASRALKLPTSRIYISETSTSTVPNTSPTAASASSDLNGMAVMIACQTILERLEPYMAANPKGSWDDWVRAAYFDRVSLSATGFFATPNIGYDWDKNQGDPFAYFTYGAACSEVEIDCLTGDHQVLRTDIVMDIGKSINPAIDIGQIEGAFVQGYGLFMLEQLKFSPGGLLYSRGPGAYKIPGFGDIPVEFNVSILKGCTNDRAVYSSKAMGEPPLFLSASVFYAVKDAIYSARADSGIQGTFRLDSPATGERIRLACTDQFTKQFPPAEPGSFTPWFVHV